MHSVAVQKITRLIKAMLSIDKLYVNISKFTLLNFDIISRKLRGIFSRFLSINIIHQVA